MKIEFCNWHTQYRRILFTVMIVCVLLATISKGWMVWVLLTIAAYALLLVMVVGMGLIIKECDQCIHKWSHEQRNAEIKNVKR